MNVDAYQLILEKGTLGALRYADAVDVENPVLASQIEEAVIRLQKLSEQVKVGTVRTAQLNYQQAPQIQIPQSWKQPLPNGEPREITLPELQQVFGKNFEKIPEDDWFSRPAAWASFLGKAGVSAAQIKMVMNGVNYYKGRHFMNLYSQAKQLGDAAKSEEYLEKVLQYKSRLPRNWQFFPGKATNYQDIFRAKHMAPNMTPRELFKADPFGGPMTPRQLQSIERSIAQKFLSDPMAASIQANPHIPKNFQALRGTPVFQEWAAAQNPQTLRILKGLGVTPRAPASASLLGQFLDDLGNLKYLRFFKTWAAKIKSSPTGGALGKALGPLFIALQTAGIIDAWRKQGGIDAKLACETLAVLANAASLIPVLTPYMLPIGIALSIGCAFVPQEKKKNKTPEQLTKADYDERMKTVTLQDLSPGDQQKIQKLMSQYGDNREALVRAFQVGARSFDNPLDAGAYVKKMWADKNKVPVSPDTSKMVPAPAF